MRHHSPGHHIELIFYLHMYGVHSINVRIRRSAILAQDEAVTRTQGTGGGRAGPSRLRIGPCLDSIRDGRAFVLGRVYWCVNHTFFWPDGITLVFRSDPAEKVHGQASPQGKKKTPGATTSPSFGGQHLGRLAKIGTCKSKNSVDGGRGELVGGF